MTPSGPDAFLLLFLSENLTHIFFTDLKYGGGGGVAGGVNGCVERWSGWLCGVSSLQ